MALLCSCLLSAVHAHGSLHDGAVIDLQREIEALEQALRLLGMD